MFDFFFFFFWLYIYVNLEPLLLHVCTVMYDTVPIQHHHMTLLLLLYLYTAE